MLELWAGLQNWGERRELTQRLVRPRSQSSANLDHEGASRPETSNLVRVLRPLHNCCYSTCHQPTGKVEVANQQL